jgi:hypothetical protein
MIMAKTYTTERPTDLICQSGTSQMFSSKPPDVYKCNLAYTDLFETAITSVRVDPRSVSRPSKKADTSIKIGVGMVAGETRAYDRPMWIAGINVKKGTACTVNDTRDTITCVPLSSPVPRERQQ